MGGNIQQGLPITLQAAMEGGSAPPTQGDASMEARNAGTLTPTPPMAPEGSQRPILPTSTPAPAGAAPDIDAPKLGGADALASLFFKHILDKDAAANAPAPAGQTPPPGSFASKLAGAAGALGAGLGDMRTGGDPSKGHGWLGAVGATLNARNERLAAKDANAEQKKKDDILNALTSAKLVQMHREFYQQDTAHRTDFYNQNEKFVDQYRTAHSVEDGVSNDELLQRMKKDPNFVSKYTARATGEVPVLDAHGKEQTDANGNPVTSPTYSIIARATKDGSPDEKELTAQEAADYKKYTGKEMPVGTKLTMPMHDSLNAQMVGIRQTAQIVGNTNGKELSQEQLDAGRTLLSDSTVQAAVAEVPGSAYAGIQKHLANADQHILAAQQQAAQAKAQGNEQAYAAAVKQINDAQAEKTKLTEFTSQYISPKQIEAKDKEDAKAGTQFGWTPQQIAEHPEGAKAFADSIIADNTGKYSPQDKQAAQTMGHVAVDTLAGKVNQKGKESEAEAKQKQKAEEGEYAGDPSLQGQPYLDSIKDIGLRNSLTAVAEGREIKSARQLQDKQGNLTPFARELHQAYPDINIANTAAYQKNLQEWTSGKPGTEGSKLENGATALKHLKELDTLFKANPNWTKMPQSDAYVRYNNLKDTLADELMKFYGAPSTTDVINAYKATIASFFNREAAISEQAKAMAEKLGAMEQTWNNLSPRPQTFHPPMPKIDDDAKRSLNYFAPDWVRAHSQFQVQSTQSQGGQQSNASQQPNAPKPTKTVVFGGQKYYTDDQGNNLGPVPKGQ